MDLPNTAEKAAVDLVMSVYLENAEPERWIKKLQKDLVRKHFEKFPDEAPVSESAAVTAKAFLILNPDSPRAKKMVSQALQDKRLSHLSEFLTL